MIRSQTKFHKEPNLPRGIFSLRSLVFPGVLFVVLLILPPIIPRFYTYTLAVILETALLAMSLNMLVGHGGLFQFHHGVFYGVGAYTVALIPGSPRR